MNLNPVNHSSNMFHRRGLQQPEMSHLNSETDIVTMFHTIIVVYSIIRILEEEKYSVYQIPPRNLGV
jgi:hypothetical protein